MTNNYRSVVDKLQKYSQKFWRLQLLKGLLLLITITIVLITAVFVIESIYYTPPYLKFTFLLIILLEVILFFYRDVLKPFLFVTGLKEFSTLQQAYLVTGHFPDLKDRLINIIELGQSDSDNKLVIKSIEQKIEKLTFFDFRSYFRFKHINKYLISLLFAAFLPFLFFAFKPGLLLGTGFRLIHLSQEFTKPAPYYFILKNKSLKILKGGSIQLNVQCKGSQLPGSVYVNIGGENFIMENQDTSFVYDLNNVQNSFAFFFTDLQFVSKKYKLEVLPDPLVLAYKVTVTPPEYTALPASTVDEISTLEVPAGSQLNWNFNCSDVDSLFITTGDTILRASETSDQEFSIQTVVKSSDVYKVLLKNNFTSKKEVLTFNVSILHDNFPTIKVIQVQDSVNLGQFYFKGIIADDYGFSNLSFSVSCMNSDSVSSVGFIPNLVPQDFYYGINFNELSQMGETFSYYFTVADNDRFHGYKKSTSEVFTYHLPGYDEVYKNADSIFSDVESMLDRSKEIVDEMKAKFEEFKYRSISENLNEWDQQQFMKQMLQKRNELQQSIDQIKSKNAQLNNLNNSFFENKEDMLNKQKEIDDLLKEIMTDELKKLFDEFNELASQFDKERFNQMMDQMDFPMEDLSKQLDRNLELLKKYKIEQGIESIISEIDRIAENEAKQFQKIDKGELEGVTENESANQKKIEELAEQLKDLQETNEELQKPMNLYPLDEEFKGIQDNYDSIKKQLSDNKSKKAKQEIENNRNQLLNLTFSLQQMLSKNQMESTGENIENLKQILKNLVFLSLEQEEILNLSENLVVSDPLLNKVQFSQDLLVLQSKQVTDSLYAIALRTPAVSSKVNNELAKIDFSLTSSVDNLKEGNFGAVVNYQQNTITSYNELALLLNEALENLEKMMANSMPGDQECDKPGGNGKGSMSKLKDAQQSLKGQLQRMIEGMKKGEEGKLGQQIGKSLMQQEILKNAISELLMDQSVGSSAKEQLGAIDKLIEQNRADLLNKNLSDNIINRQNLILDHLLKAEKAEMERDVDENRESTTAEQKFYSNPDLLFEYKEREKNKTEDLRFNSVRMRKFYEEKYRSYINKVNQ